MKESGLKGYKLISQKRVGKRGNIFFNYYNWGRYLPEEVSQILELSKFYKSIKTCDC